MSADLRIASLLASATEMICGLGLSDRLVAVSHECDFPAEVLDRPRVTRSLVDDRAASGDIDQQVKDRTAAGEALYEIDEVQLAELAPGLIVTQAQCDVCAVRFEDVLAAVARQPALAETKVVALNPASLSDVLDDIRRVARAAGAEAEGEACFAGLNARIDAIRQAVSRATQRPRVALIEWIDPLMLSGNWMPELVQMAGGEHGLTIAGAHSPYVSWDDLAAYDPERIVVTPCGFDLERTLAEAELLRSNPVWPHLRAVHSGQTYAVDGNAYFNRAGPRLVDSLEILAHLLHPELVAAPGRVGEPKFVWRRL
jgi:iron complex transport system substrate-binding protein